MMQTVLTRAREDGPGRPRKRRAAPSRATPTQWALPGRSEGRGYLAGDRCVGL